MGGGEEDERKVEDVVMEEVESAGKGGDSEMKDVSDEAVVDSKHEEEAGKVDKEDEEEEAGEGGEGKNDEEEDEEEEEEKEPVTPSEGRPARERRTVERLSMVSVARSSTPKSVPIAKGNGEKLSEIPNVAYKLSKRKPDENLQLLHSILFGKKAKVHVLKKNIGQFSGFVWLENEEKQKAKIKEKLDKCVKEKLIDFCYLLNVPINKTTTKKEDISVKLIKFLQSPHATTDALLADAEKKTKTKRKVTPSKVEESSATPAKKRKTSSEGSKKQKKASKEEEHGSEEAQLDDDSDEENHVDALAKENTDSENLDEEPKQKSGRKGSSKRKASKESIGRDKSKVSKEITPAKSTKKGSSSTKKDTSKASVPSASHSKAKGSAAKKQDVEKEKEIKVQSKEETTTKKETSKTSAKVPPKNPGKSNAKKSKQPTREEMHAVVVNILKEVDFNTATLSDILRQLGAHFDVDLLHRKAEVKEIITEVISNMSDDEEDEDDEKDDTEAKQDKNEDNENEEDKENKQHEEEEKDSSDEDEKDKHRSQG